MAWYVMRGISENPQKILRSDEQIHPGGVLSLKRRYHDWNNAVHGLWKNFRNMLLFQTKGSTCCTTLKL